MRGLLLLLLLAKAAVSVRSALEESVSNSTFACTSTHSSARCRSTDESQSSAAQGAALPA